MKKPNESLIIDTKSRLKILEEQVKREAIIAENHPYSIWMDKNGRWQTYLPDEKKSRKVKLISSNDKLKLERIVCDFYNENTPTFEDIYTQWMERRFQLKQIAAGTYGRNNCIFNRFFKYTIGDKKINEFCINDFIDVMEEQIAKFDLDYKAFSGMQGVIKGTLNYAKRKNLIDFSGYDVINEFKTVSESRLRQRQSTDESEVFNNEETKLVTDYLSGSKKPVDLCLLLIFATGMRVGEAVAIKHSDFNDMTVKIQRTESRYTVHGMTERIVKERPKTMAGIRTIVIPTVFTDLIRQIKMLNPFGEYVFIGDKGERMGTTAVRKRLADVCDALDIKRRSPHKIRKTYLSILLDNQVDLNFVTQQAGHASISTTEAFYHWNRKSDTYKREILDSLPEFQSAII